MSAFLNLAGQRFGRLVVIAPSESRKGQWWWRCVCDCGAEVVKKGHRIRRGETASCGCIKTDILIERNYRHGNARTVEYRSWKHMRQRCTNPNDKKYADYGGRGISVCERWSKFENFIADMGPKPSRAHSIEKNEQ